MTRATFLWMSIFNMTLGRYIRKTPKRGFFLLRVHCCGDTQGQHHPRVGRDR